MFSARWSRKTFTHRLAILVLPLLTGFFSCDIKSEKLVNPFPPPVHLDSLNKVTRLDFKILFEDSAHFEMIKFYIEKTGVHERISISAIAGDTSLLVDYYTIKRGEWEITKDSHSRIYFSQEDCSYGNVFLLQDAVYVEPYYTGPEENIDTLNEIILPIKGLYNQLRKEALKY